ncbi:MAG: hypothetical protein WKF87_08730 [Chryseolinea sp.]
MAPAKKSPKKSSRKPAKKTPKKSAKKTPKKPVKNSLVANINARKKSGTSRPKSKSTVSKKAYKKLKNNWGKKKS